MSSVVKSDHKAVVEMSRGAPTSIVKTRQQRTYRPKTPSQNAGFLRHLATIDLTSRPDPHELARKADPQAVYDAFYASATGLLLDAFYLFISKTIGLYILHAYVVQRHILVTGPLLAYSLCTIFTFHFLLISPVLSLYVAAF